MATRFLPADHAHRDRRHLCLSHPARRVSARGRRGQGLFHHDRSARLQPAGDGPHRPRVAGRNAARPRRGSPALWNGRVRDPSAQPYHLYRRARVDASHLRDARSEGDRCVHGVDDRALPSLSGDAGFLDARLHHLEQRRRHPRGRARHQRSGTARDLRHGARDLSSRRRRDRGCTDQLRSFVAHARATPSRDPPALGETRRARL